MYVKYLTVDNFFYRHKVSGASAAPKMFLLNYTETRGYNIRSLFIFVLLTTLIVRRNAKYNNY